MVETKHKSTTFLFSIIVQNIKKKKQWVHLHINVFDRCSFFFKEMIKEFVKKNKFVHK